MTVPEFPTIALLPLLMIGAVLVILYTGKRALGRPRN